MSDPNTNHVDRLMAESQGSGSHVDRLMGTESVPEDVGTITLQDRFIEKQKEKRRKKESMQLIERETMADSVSREIGVPLDMIDTSGADFMTRVDFSFSDTEEDIRAKFKQKYPNGEILRLEYNPQARYKQTGKTFSIRNKESVLLYRENAYDDEGNWLPLSEDNKLKTIEGEGGGYKDIADLAGPSLPFAGSIAVGAAAPAGIAWGALYIGGGYLAGELAKHETNIYAFDSNMEQEEAFKDALKEGAEVALLVALTGGAYKLGKRLTQKGAKAFLSDASDAVKAIRKRAMEWVDSVQSRRANVPGLTAEQIAPENAILDRLAKQGKSTSAAARHREVEQKTGVLEILREDAVSTAEKLGRQLRSRVNRIYNAQINRIRKAIFGRRRITTEQGGVALTDGARSWQRQAGPRGNLGKEYQKLDGLADEAQPVFSLSVRTADNNLSVREIVYQTRTAVMAEARALSQEGVNVAGTPVGQFARILDDLDAMASTQFDYKALKAIRTRLGAVIEKWPWDASVNSHYARRVYGALTDVMLNPVRSVGPKTKAYVDQAVNATAKARAYYDMIDDPVIRKVLQSSSPAMLAAEIGTPLHLTPNVRKLISEMPEQYSQAFRSSVLTNDILLHPGGANARMDEWILAHPEGWSFLVKNDKALIKNMRQGAQAIDELRASNLFSAAQSKDMSVSKTLLRGKDVGRKEISFLWRNAGSDGKEKLRQAMYNDIVDNVVIEGPHGIAFVDPKKLASIRDEYKKSGAWDIVFSAADRDHISGMKAYIDLAYKYASDAGVSLQAAEAISQLKKPSTFISGVHKLTVNTLMNRLISNKAFVEWVATHNLDKPIVLNTARSYTKFFALATEALLEGTEPGQQVDPFSNTIDAAIETAKGVEIQPIIDRLKETQIPGG